MKFDDFVVGQTIIKETVEELSKDSDPQSWADLTESLKRSVRKTLKNQEVLLG